MKKIVFLLLTAFSINANASLLCKIGEIICDAPTSEPPGTTPACHGATVDTNGHCSQAQGDAAAKKKCGAAAVVSGGGIRLKVSRGAISN